MEVHRDRGGRVALALEGVDEEFAALTAGEDGSLKPQALSRHGDPIGDLAAGQFTPAHAGQTEGADQRAGGSNSFHEPVPPRCRAKSPRVSGVVSRQSVGLKRYR